MIKEIIPGKIYLYECPGQDDHGCQVLAIGTESFINGQFLEGYRKGRKYYFRKENLNMLNRIKNKPKIEKI